MTHSMPDIVLAAVIIGLALSTFVTRTSFLIAGARLRLGARIEVALRYAPVCTLSAIIVPDVLMHPPSYTFDDSLMNPRLIGAFAAGAWLCFSRNIIGCLATGMFAYTAARLWLI
jgi:branched-subunit amino acid transport protein